MFHGIQQNYLLVNTFGLSNATSDSKEHLVAGYDRANKRPVLVMFYTLFMIDRNKIAEQLSAAFPEWNEKILFNEARKINVSRF